MADPAERAERGNEVIGGLALQGDDHHYQNAIAKTIAWQAELRAQCLTAAEAARHLGMPLARMRRMLRRRELVATKAEGRWLVLRSQFEGSRLVPHTSTVAQALPAGLSFLAAANWLSLPNSDLEVADEPVSPLEWLKAGGDSGVVAELAREL